MSPPRLLRLAPVYAAVLVSAACTDMTGPTGAVQPTLIEIGAATTLGVAVDDVLDRVLAGLDEGAERNGIDAAVREVSAALVSRAPGQLKNANDLFHESFDKYAALQPEGSINPDLEAVRLLLDETQVLTTKVILIPKTTQ